MNTPTPGDLSARHWDAIRALLTDYRAALGIIAKHEGPVASKISKEAEEAIAALSALPAAGGHMHVASEDDGDTCAVCGRNFRAHATTPQPSAAEPKCGCGRPGEYESEDGPACNKYFRCKDAAVGAQGDGWWEGLGYTRVSGIECVVWQHTTTGERVFADKGRHSEVDALLKSRPAAPAAGKGVDERTRFITWANQRGMVAFDCEAAFGMEADDRFISPDTSLAWAAWQAALTRQPAITTDS